MAKVVYSAAPSGNGRGGFGLSRAATERLAAMGLGSAQRHIAAGKQGTFYDVDRHDPRLVRVVEEMGSAADGDGADLRIAESDDWRAYDIHSTLDGRERIHWVQAEGIAPEKQDETNAILRFMADRKTYYERGSCEAAGLDVREACRAKVSLLESLIGDIERGDHMKVAPDGDS